MFDNSENTYKFAIELAANALEADRSNYIDKLGLEEERRDDITGEIYIPYDRLMTMSLETHTLQDFESVLSKDVRLFTQSEAWKYLDVSDYIVTRACKKLDIDTSRFSYLGWNWMITLAEIYRVRDFIRENVTRKSVQIPKKKKPLSCIISTIMNQKGGAGKTTLVHHLGTGFAIRYQCEYKILLIDFDPQGTLSAYSNQDVELVMGWKSGILGDQDVSSGDILLAESDQEAVKLAKMAVRKTTIPNMDIIPSRSRDQIVEKILLDRVKNNSRDYNPYRTLDAALKELKLEYDFIFIDTNPHVTALSAYNALYAANNLLIPFSATEQDYQTTIGWLKTFPAQSALMAEYGYKGLLEPPTLVLTNMKGSLTYNHIEDDIRSKFDHVLSTEHLQSEAISKANSMKSSLYEVSLSALDITKKTYDRAMMNTNDLLDEILKKFKKQQRRIQEKGEVYHETK